MRFCLYVILVAALLASSGISAEAPRNTRRHPAPAGTMLSVVKTDPRSGRMVKMLVVPGKTKHAAATMPGASESMILSAGVLSVGNLKSLVETAARNYDVPQALINSVIEVESNYNQYAVSPKGAQGLMQLMPATARRFGVKNTFDPKENIEGGVRYLKFLQNTFKNDRLALAAYNAGEGAVQRYGAIPPYPETVDYVAKVGRKYEKNRPAAVVAEVPSQENEAAPKEPEYRRLAQFTDAQGRVYLTTQ